MNSKKRIAKYILPIMLKNRRINQYYVEPFAKKMNTIHLVAGNRIANDINEYVIEMWKAVVERNWIPPVFVDEATYNEIKHNKTKYPKELVGFVGSALSFGSKWFDNYARNKKETNFAIEGRNNIMKKVDNLKNVKFSSVSYDKLIIPSNSIIYCDLSYQNVSKYRNEIDYNAFFDWCRKKSKEGHSVFVSEYDAPSDFKKVWSHELKRNLSTKTRKFKKECLFTI